MDSLQTADLRKVVDHSLHGRVAIVTGAGQGLGRVFAKAFAMAGAIPVIAERNHDKGKAVAAEIGNEAFAIHTDVADPASIDSMVAEVDRRFGRVDILVNNAGIFSTLEMRPFDHVVSSLEDLRAIVRAPDPGARTLLKERTTLDAHCRAFIARSPLLLMATAAATGS